MSPHILLPSLFTAAISATQPARCMPAYLPTPPKGRIVVIGAGKAAASMAQAVERHWPDEQLSGLVITRYGHQIPCEKIEVVQAAHPVPDAAGVAASKRILELVSDLGPDDLVLCLLSGGGSALLSLPAPGISLEQKQEITEYLLKSGATIHEMNCVRKHLSAIKGGRLALAIGQAQLLSLMISDVPGDDPATIASGPTLPDQSTREEALAICAKYQLKLPENVHNWLQQADSETPKSDDPRFGRYQHQIVASNLHALKAAAAIAKQIGIHPYILSDSIEGEARDVALVHAAIVQQILRSNEPEYCPFQRPCLILSGGETTVTVDGFGRGGRNTEFLLSLCIALNGMENVYAIACDTDGIDGSENNAGAICGPTSLARGQALGLNAQAHLNNNDAFGFFAAVGDLIVTGPSLTNVNDFRAILVL